MSWPPNEGPAGYVPAADIAAESDPDAVFRRYRADSIADLLDDESAPCESRADPDRTDRPPSARRSAEGPIASCSTGPVTVEDPTAAPGNVDWSDYGPAGNRR